MENLRDPYFEEIKPLFSSPESPSFTSHELEDPFGLMAQNFHGHPIQLFESRESICHLARIIILHAASFAMWSAVDTDWIMASLRNSNTLRYQTEETSTRIYGSCR